MFFIIYLNQTNRKEDAMHFSKIVPLSYFEEVKEKAIWTSVLSKFGIRIRRKSGTCSSPRVGDYITLCPFHKEKSPSMHLYNNSKRYHCYGCGSQGDVFTFIAIMLGGVFHGDIIMVYHWLKKNYDIPLPWEKKKTEVRL